MRRNSSRAVAVVTAAALAVTSFGIAPSFAASGAPKDVEKTIQLSQAGETTDFSSRSRRYRNRAAGAAVLGAIIGGIATYAAAREYRKARERELQYRYGYYGNPHYYAPRRHYYRHW